MKFVLGRTLTILSWNNPVTAYFRKKQENCAIALAGHRAAILFNLKFVVKVDPVSRIKKLEERDSFRYRVLFISVLSFCGILQG